MSSAASAWEIATKVRIGKMPQGRPLAENFAAYLPNRLQSFQPLPISIAHAAPCGSNFLVLIKTRPTGSSPPKPSMRVTLPW